MKVFLDDTRSAPKGWSRTHWPEATIGLLEKHNVTHLSLDHDLGDDSRGTGYDVLTWIERKVTEDPNYCPPAMFVHSANPPARRRMEMAIASINRIVGRRQCNCCQKIWTKRHKTQWWELNSYFGLSGLYCGQCYEKVQHDAFGIPRHPISYWNILKRMKKSS